MTTIAFKDGIMAADTQITIQGDGFGALKAHAAKKIAKDSEGVLYGICGTYAQCTKVIEALKRQAKTGGAVPLPVPTRDDDFEILIAYPDGRLRSLIPQGEILLDDAKYYAIGSGASVAMGAMFAGASARVAVLAAIEHSEGTGGKVEQLHFDLEHLPPHEVDEIPVTAEMKAADGAMREYMEQGPVKIVDGGGVYPDSLDRAAAEQAAYYAGNSFDLVKTGVVSAGPQPTTTGGRALSAEDEFDRIAREAK